MAAEDSGTVNLFLIPLQWNTQHFSELANLYLWEFLPPNKSSVGIQWFIYKKKNVQKTPILPLRDLTYQGLGLVSAVQTGIKV